ncbi:MULTISPECIES: hypothetical protein [unclassified Rhodococcus (in: high G+C Gram-positive bacteria)]|uniref:hypothetical protein n=1 Tax=unclassified Rhodococcus (in: high G+C Gram-positive bacteria) TaxID=192944 RepID=UPI001BB30683|nr:MULTISPECIES: hypothetical protein [unclassified Rhodococcus (in: high G+C Gram-positive bacteria)]
MTATGTPTTPLALDPGGRIRFGIEPRRPYTVRALSEHFVVCTRQRDFATQGQFVYTVIDWRNGIRGPVNVIGQSTDVGTDEQCRTLLRDLESGRCEISHRNRVQLDILARDEP